MGFISAIWVLNFELWVLFRNSKRAFNLERKKFGSFANWNQIE
jgi:hypothetical protein